MFRALRRILISVLVFPLTAIAVAQIHGIPPSVTSIGPNGISSMPPASVTSLGPFGWQVPRNFNFGRPPSFGIGHFPRHGNIDGRIGFGHGRRNWGAPMIVVPLYAPYPVVAYPQAYGTVYTENEDNNQAPMQPQVPQAPAVPRPSDDGGAAELPRYASPPAAPAAPASPSSAMPEVREQEITVLVFRDGHRLQVTNYAIVGQELINLSGNGPRRIALTDLDVPATTLENDERGVVFRVPAQS